MKLSIVSTLYNSQRTLAEFIDRSLESANKLFPGNFEIILVNDGSPDQSLSLARSFLTKISNLKIIDLSRNFGHHKAMMTGIMQAKGELIYLIDSDLEEEPEWLEMFYQKLILSNCDVVYGVQASRKGGWAERFGGQLFYKLVNYASNLKLSENIVTARLMTLQYCKALSLHTESEVFIAGLWRITGFEQISLQIKKHQHSPTNYTLSKKIELFIAAITSFSNRPLILIFYLGLFILIISALAILFILISAIFYEKPLSGWTSLILSIWLLGGLTISFIGITGIYISKIFIETKRRPYTIIKRIYSNE